MSEARRKVAALSADVRRNAREQATSLQHAVATRGRVSKVQASAGYRERRGAGGAPVSARRVPGAPLIRSMSHPLPGRGHTDRAGDEKLSRTYGPSDVRRNAREQATSPEEAVAA
jgi:hypothetical protein